MSEEKKVRGRRRYRWMDGWMDGGREGGQGVQMDVFSFA
jgi:hypothetical protein